MVALGLPELINYLGILNMSKIRKSHADDQADFPGASTAAAVNYEEVEQVLEHISSPYRWEILEVPLAKSTHKRHKIREP